MQGNKTSHNKFKIIKIMYNMLFDRNKNTLEIKFPDTCLENYQKNQKSKNIVPNNLQFEK